MHLRCRRDVRRDRRVGLLDHLGRRRDRPNRRVRDRRLGHQPQTCLASDPGLDGSASLLVMDGFRHPDALRHRAVRRLAYRHGPDCRLDEDRPDRLGDRPDVDHPGRTGKLPDVAYRLGQLVLRVGEALGAPRSRRMGCWPRVARVRPASGLALLRFRQQILASGRILASRQF